MFDRQTALALTLTTAWLGNADGASRALEEFCAYFSATFETEASSLRLVLASESQSTRLILTTSSLTFSTPPEPSRRQVAWNLPLRSPVSFIVQCRKAGVVVACDGRFGGAFARQPGKCRLKIEAAKGVAVADARFQPYEPVLFSDDFMRADDEDDSVWTTVKGEWQLSKAAQVSYAASPFRLQCVEGQDALYATGYRFWHDYLCQVSVRPQADKSSVGLGFYLSLVKGQIWRAGVPLAVGPATKRTADRSPRARQDRHWSSAGRAARAPDAARQNDVVGFLFRWNGVDHRFEVIRRTAQGEELMAQRPGSLRVRQWYRLGIAVCGTHVRCLVDETEVLRASSTWLVEGSVGLYASPSDGAVDFDDVLVRGLPFPPDEFAKLSAQGLVSWMRSVQPSEEVINPTFRQDKYMQNWAVASAMKATDAKRYGYTFYRAPVDWWVTTGKWEAYSRWSCRPEWSFFSGIDDRLALVWNKRRCPGDVRLDVYVGNPMVSMRPPFYGQTSLNLTICGDGSHPFSGYALVMGGWNKPETQLYRKGQLVARTDQAVVPSARPADYHREWFHLELAREGRRILFAFQGRKALEFTDADPLTGERVGLWARDPGISVAQARVFCSEEPSMWTPLEPRDPVTAPPRGWQALDGEHGARLSKLREGDTQFVRLTNTNPGGTFAAAPPGCPFDAFKKSHLAFRYRMGPGILVNLYFRKGDDWHVLQFAGPTQCGRPVKLIGKLPDPQTDGRWHSAKFDLLGPFRELYPQAAAIQIDEMRIGLLEPPELLAAGLGGNKAGAFFDIADFEIQPELRSPRSPDRGAGVVRRPRQNGRVTGLSRPFLDDFEDGIGRWERFGGPEGAYLFRDTETCAAGKASLLLYKETHGGVFGARWQVTPFRLDEYPVLRFDYRMPDQVRVGLLFRVGEEWLSVILSPNEKAARKGQNLRPVVRDGQWHRTEINLLELTNNTMQATGDLWVNDLMFCDQSEASTIGYAGNMKGNRYWLDNVELVPSGKKLALAPPPRPDLSPKKPWVAVMYPDRLFFEPFEEGPMPWRDWCCGMVDFAPFGAVGKRCARIFGYKPAAWYSTMIWKDWIDLDRHPILRFDYRIPCDAVIGFAVNLDEFFYLLPFSKKVDLEKIKPERRTEYLTALVPGCRADGDWHTAEIDLLEYVKRRFPNREHYRVRDLRTQRMGGTNPLGVSCYFDNVSIHSRKPGKVRLIWQAPPDATAQSYHVDLSPDTIPDETPEEGGPSATFDLGPGRHYFHLRARAASGTWGEAVHVPVVLGKE